MREVISCDPASGCWTTVPLHVFHRNLACFAGEDQQNAECDHDGGEEELTYPAHDSESSNQALVALGSGPNIDTHTSPTQPSVRPPTSSHDWHAVEEHEERLIRCFVGQASTILSLQCCASLILSKVLKHMHRENANIRPTAYVVAGVCAVGAGIAILGKADCGIRRWFAEETEDGENANHDSESMPDLSVCRSTEETLGTLPQKKPRTLTLACHRAAWRTGAQALMSAGFAISMAPLLGSQAEDYQTRLMTFCGFLGSSCCAATLCLTQRIVNRAMHLGRLRTLQATEEDPFDDISHGEGGKGADACLHNNTSEIAQVLGAARRQPEAFLPKAAAHHPHSAATGSLLMNVSFAAAVFSGGYAMSRWAEHVSGSGVKLAWTNSVAAAGRPVFLGLLAAGDLRNKYRTCHLRVFCPPHARLEAEGASRSLQMWHSEDQLLHHSALEGQLISLQVSAHMHTHMHARPPISSAFHSLPTLAIISNSMLRFPPNDRRGDRVTTSQDPNR
jgi:hypothetical protein